MKDLPPIKLRLTADSQGRLSGINMGERTLRSFKELHAAILEIVGTDTGPNSMAAQAECEIDADYDLRYENVIEAITAISGHVQAVGDGVVPMDEMEDSLEAVTEEVRRLERLVNDLLDLTRLEAHQFRVVSEEVGLEALLEQAAASFREKARANDIEFDTTTAAAPTVMSDGDRVLQIVTNLLDNAFRIAAITISDSGPWIAPGDLQSVFHPFYSRRGEGGTGLGLSIARELAQALGGRLAVDSQLGKGSTFTLSLPRNRRRRRR